MTLLLHPNRATKPQQGKLRYRKGICNILYRGIPAGQKVSLDEAVAILRAGW